MRAGVPTGTLSSWAASIPSHRTGSEMLVLIKLLHTVVWLFFVACIAGIYLFAHAGNFRWAFAMVGVVAVEVVILALNRMSCPLTPIAARYTRERTPNFDIYLPAWLAKYNKEIFGTLYVGGCVDAVVLWLRA